MQRTITRRHAPCLLAVLAALRVPSDMRFDPELYKMEVSETVHEIDGAEPARICHESRL